MIINGISTSATHFAYDGCHKIYLIEDTYDEWKAGQLGYTIKPIKDIKTTYERSCSLKFIHNFKLDKTFVKQFEQWDPYNRRC